MKFTSTVPGKEIAWLTMDSLVHEAAVVELRDVRGDYDVSTSQMVTERVEVQEGDMPTADEIRYMVKHPMLDREFAG